MTTFDHHDEHPASHRNIAVMLIGGTSHTGKTSFGQTLATHLGWRYLSTDGIARHPGRPFREDGNVPPHVRAHYRTRSTSELVSDVVRHYENIIWPAVSALIRHYTGPNADRGLVLEGSALMPRLVHTLSGPSVTAVWLTLPHTELRARIEASARMGQLATEDRRLVNRFIDRTLAFDDLIHQQFEDGQLVLNCAHQSREQLRDWCMELIRQV